ncbi:MAG: TerD family protein [Candidatus Obscuribacter sp.]|nr:TerD family protein [Candidatus Obscuribacter sp.]
MAISLKKGQGVSLKKIDNDLSAVTIGLGWDIKEAEKKGLIGSLFGKKEEDYGLDVVAFLCAADGKVKDLGKLENGKPTLANGDVVFFNSMKHHSGQIWLTGDNRTGAGDGDDEQIIVKLNDLPERYEKIVFVVQIYKGIANGQSFGMVKNAFIRAEDGKGREMARFDLSGGPQYADCRSMLFAELVREAGGWKLNAIGDPSPSDSFVEWLKKYT